MTRDPLPSGGRHVEAAITAYLRDAATGGTASQSHLLGTGAVASLERRLSDHYGKRRALAVANATTGLLALARALGLGEGDVIVPPLTWGGSVAGLLELGARLVFGDVDPTTLALCPEAASRAVTGRTRAILAVDLFGVPADDQALRRLADEYGLWYLHDAAQSLGATRAERAAGSLADAVVVSFTSGKTLFAGEGGAILTDSDDLYERLIWETQHPYRQKREIGLRVTNEFALNARIHPLAAVWAEADFEAALARLAGHQAHMDALVRLLDGSGLTEPLGYSHERVHPAYFSLSAAWRSDPEPNRLVELFGEAGHALQILPFRLQPLYQQPAWSARQSQHPCSGACPTAEAQVRRRFELLAT